MRVCITFTTWEYFPNLKIEDLKELQVQEFRSIQYCENMVRSYFNEVQDVPTISGQLFRPFMDHYRQHLDRFRPFMDHYRQHLDRFRPFMDHYRQHLDRFRPFF